MKPLPRAAVAAVFALLAAALFAAPRLRWTPGGGLSRERPQVASGDEPHYLLAVSSLLFDGDLELADDYRRVREGGPGAGERSRHQTLDHHTLLVDRLTGERALWSEVYDRTRPHPCWPPQSCVGFELRDPRWLSRARIAEVPAHPIAFPALLAALLLPLRPSPDQVEALCLDAQAALAWLCALALYLAAQRGGLSRGQALAAAVLCALCSPWLAYGRSLFAETAIGLALTLGLWAAIAERPALVGLSIAAAAALKPNFAAVGGAWVLERLWAQRPRQALPMALVAGVGGVALVAVNQLVLGAPLPAGTLVWRWARGPEALGATLFADHHGLLAFVPWAALPLLAALRMRRGADPGAAPDQPPILRLVALPALAHLAILSVNGNAQGYCYGPRYWVPLLPLLALAAVDLARRRGRLYAGALLALAVLSAAIAVPGALRYLALFERPVSQSWSP